MNAPIKLPFKSAATGLFAGRKAAGSAGNPYKVTTVSWNQSWIALGVVIIVHLLALVAFGSSPDFKEPETPPVPIMVSMISGPGMAKSSDNAASMPKQSEQKIIAHKTQVNKPIEKAVKRTKSLPNRPAERPMLEQKQKAEPLSAKESSPALTSSKSEPAPAVSKSGQSNPVSNKASFQDPSFNAGYLHNPPPRYPSMSKRLGEQGRVLMRVMVSAAGEAMNVSLHASSGSTRLDEAAIDAVANWRFVPAKRNGHAVSASVLVPI